MYKRQQGSHIDGDVMTGFINHPHHAQRHAAAFDAQTAVKQTAVDHLADRIGQVAHLANICLLYTSRCV